MRFALLFPMNAKRSVTEVHVRQTATATREGREAAKAADNAIALDPGLPDGYIARASIRSDSNAWDLQGARADVERALALSPNDTATLMAKAHLLLFLRSTQLRSFVGCILRTS